MQKEEREQVFNIFSGVLPRNVSKLPYTFDRVSNLLNKETNTPDWPLVSNRNFLI